jgi:hypothetical protein
MHNPHPLHRSSSMWTIFRVAFTFACSMVFLLLRPVVKDVAGI